MVRPRSSYVPNRDPKVISGPRRERARSPALGGDGEAPAWGGRRCAMRTAIKRTAAMTLMSCFLAGGCVAAVGAGTVAATGKTPVDHIVSLATGKDCSIVRQHRGLTYCVEDEVTPAVRVHCYPTIGAVGCYGEPDPFPG